MRKKIYAVKKGEKTGIYDDYKKCEAQVKGFKGAVFLSFDYKTEFENEDENKEYSLRHAFLCAEEFMSDVRMGGLKLVYQGKNKKFMEEESWKKDGFLPFGEEAPDDMGDLQGAGENDGVKVGFCLEDLNEDPEDLLPFEAESPDGAGDLQNEGEDDGMENYTEDHIEDDPEDLFPAEEEIPVDVNERWSCEGVYECLARRYGEGIRDDINAFIDEAYSENINDYLSSLCEAVAEDIRERFECFDPFEGVDVNAYLAELVYTDYIGFQQRKQKEAERRSSSHTAEATGMEKLNQMIGLAEAKKQIRKIAALAKMKKDMAENSNVDVSVALHMGFVGNPGTAKTTVARIVAEIFHEIGLLPDGELIEVGRADLVSDHIGGTAKQVKEVFSRARGKVLFIDEAYSLVDDHQTSFGDEAINTIIQEMENNRDKTIVIFAGYPAEMESFFSRNPGLRSRVRNIVRFSDYSAEDMVKITELEAKRRGFSISTEAYEKVDAICSEAVLHPNWGNGRFCRNLIEDALLNYAERNYEINDGMDSGAKNNDLILIAGDFPSAAGGDDTKENVTKENVTKKFPIGFHARGTEDRG